MKCGQERGEKKSAYSIKAPLVPVSSLEAVETMYTSASRTDSWKTTLRAGPKRVVSSFPRSVRKVARGFRG